VLAREIAEVIHLNPELVEAVRAEVCGSTEIRQGDGAVGRDEPVAQRRLRPRLARAIRVTALDEQSLAQTTPEL